MLKQNKPMHIMALGLRGFPGIQGGVETHAQHLYPELVKLGCRVEVLTRKPFVKDARTSWEGVCLKPLWSPRQQGVESLVHSFIAVCYAIISRPDVVHIHAIGPALFAPLARLFGLKVVMTHHGMDYHREKWGWCGKTVLRWGERLGVTYSHACITVSATIKNHLQDTFGKMRDTVVVFNGVNIPTIAQDSSGLAAFGLKPKTYYLMVSRFVPEKRQDDLIEAFIHAKAKDSRKLVIVGRYEAGTNAYQDKVIALSKQHPNIILTGFKTGDALSLLYSHAECFILPSSHEGLPIALLEALSYGLYPIVSNIPAHTEMKLENKHYFSLGDTKQLAEKMDHIPTGGFNDALRMETIAHVKKTYNWHTIALETFAVFQRVVKKC